MRAQIDSRPVVLDLLDVDGFDIDALLIAVQNLWPVVDVIDAFDFIVRDRTPRTATISAAHVLGVSFRIRVQRDA